MKFFKQGVGFAIAVSFIAVSACGISGVLDNSSNNFDPNDLSTVALKPDVSWHDQYLTGRHSRFICADCHTSTARINGAALREIDGKLICNQCHSGEYGRTDLFNHAQYKTGTYCNSCHFSDTFRQIARIPHDKFHHAIGEKTLCVECHDNKTPSKHRGQGLNGSCQICHKYPKWSGATFDHSVVTSGCADCHNRPGHFGPSCEWCHTQGISWGYIHGVGDSRGCEMCHQGGNYD
ncbi:MAG: hypothetical protein OEV92_01800 [Nitrospinota bacterium]|nr:hypothetical protein [Nitrospinota bacterium]